MVISRSSVWYVKDCCVQGQGHSEDSHLSKNDCFCHIRAIYLNHLTSWASTLYCCALLPAGMSCEKIGLLPSRSRSQREFSFSQINFVPNLMSYWTFCNNTLMVHYSMRKVWISFFNVKVTVRVQILNNNNKRKDCLFHVFWTADLFTTKPGGDVYHLKSWCCTKCLETPFSIKARVQVLCMSIWQLPQ